jgi:uncharacterized membrane protein YhaH (DUF805 family)
MTDLHPSYCQCEWCERRRARKGRQEFWLRIGITALVSVLVCVAFFLLTRPTF